MSQIDFILLYIFLFALFYAISQIRQGFLDRNYWQVMLPILLSFTLVIGLRYGWGNDYMSYKYRFEHPYHDEDPFFGSINGLLGKMGFNYVGAFLTYALMLCWGGFLYLKSYKNNKYMLALFLPAIFYSATFMIRQGFATSFLFFGFYYLRKRKFLWAGLFLLLAVKTHTGILTVMLLPILFGIIQKWYDKPLPYKIVIPVYVVIALAQDASSAWFASHMSDAFAFLENFGKFSSYSDRSDYWFGEEGISDIYVQSVFTKYITVAYEASVLYLSALALKYRREGRVVVFYNTVVVGMFIMRIGFLLEIIHRIGQSIMSYYFIPLGFAMYVLRPMMKKKELKRIECKVVSLSMMVIVLYLVAYFGRIIFLSPTYKFVWNI